MSRRRRGVWQNRLSERDAHQLLTYALAHCGDGPERAMVVHPSRRGMTARKVLVKGPDGPMVEIAVVGVDASRTRWKRWATSAKRWTRRAQRRSRIGPASNCWPKRPSARAEPVEGLLTPTRRAATTTCT
jgi:hypothetical protein